MRKHALDGEGGPHALPSLHEVTKISTTTESIEGSRVMRTRCEDGYVMKLLHNTDSTYSLMQ